MNGPDLPPELRALMPCGDRMGSRPCDDWLVQVGTLGGVAGDCRDTEDLQALESGWRSMGLDIAGIKAPELQEEARRFASDMAEFQLWDAKMRDGYSYTTKSAEVSQFDGWAGKLDGWRQWYKRISGHSASGPEVVKPPGSGGGIGGLLDKAGSLLLLGGAVFVAYNLTRKGS